MKPYDMARIATGVIACGEHRINLLVPKNKMPKGFPRGEFVCETHRGKMHSFDAMKVLLFLIANGLVVPRIEADMLVLQPPSEPVIPTD